MRALALTSSHPARIDALRSEDASLLLQVVGIASFVMLAALGAQVRIFLWEVPITLQTLAIYGSGLFLGARNGSLAMILYLLVGLFFPVFASEAYGPAYLFGAMSAGYLLAAPLAALTVGTLSRRWNTFAGSALALIVGSAVLFSLGVTWLHFAAGHESWWMSIERGWLRFVVWDITKVALVALCYVGVRRLTSRG